MVRWFRLYLSLTALSTASLVISCLGLEALLFDELGGGIEINLVDVGLMIKGFSGLWRNFDIAAWFIAAAGCLLVVLAATTRKPQLIALAVVIAVAVLGLATLTGRRKALALAAGFAVLFPLIASGGVLLLVVFLGLNVPGWLVPVAQGFVARLATTFSDMDERFRLLGVGSPGWATNWAGWIGFGVGAGAQDSQYLNVQATSAAVGGAAEAGSGKFLIELGLPGLLLAFTFSFFLAQQFFRICRASLAKSGSCGMPVCGLAAFVGANIPVFLLASQIYGNPFVPLILGFFSGTILAAPEVIHRRRQVVRRLAVQQHV